jgi:hypothetical protein
MKYKHGAPPLGTRWSSRNGHTVLWKLLPGLSIVKVLFDKGGYEWFLEAPEDGYPPDKPKPKRPHGL